MRVKDMLYAVVIAVICALALMHGAKASDTIVLPGDYELDVYDVGYGRKQGEMYDYETGDYYDVDLEPAPGGGYTGTAWRYGDNRAADVDVDRFGVVDVWHY